MALLVADHGCNTDSSVPEFFGKHAEEFRNCYQRSPQFIERFNLWSRLIDRCLDSKQIASCIDVGCGPGLFSRYVAKKGIPTIGIDPAAEMLDLCREGEHELPNESLHFLRSGLPLPEDLSIEPADLVLCSSVLEYVDDLDECITSLTHVVEQSGFLIVSLPNVRSVLRKCERFTYQVAGIPEYVRHVKNLFTLGEAKRQFEAFGFRFLDAAYYGGMNGPVGLLERVLPTQFYRTLFVMVLQKQ